MEPKHYDLIVIGSGPAGEKGAAQAAYFGKKVALVERAGVMGGAAANTGTLPAKTLRETALYLTGFRQRGLYGVHLALKDKVTVRDFMFRERMVKEDERSRIRQNLKHHRIDIYAGEASFVDTHTICVQPDRSPKIEIRADHILIATGSAPFRPEVVPFHDPDVYDSDTILALHEIPQTMLVVGGGVIGCEYACVFAALGIKVTLVEGRDKLLPFLDAEISHALTSRMTALGIDLRLSDSVESMEGGEFVQTRLRSGARLSPETVLVAAGRTGNTASLHLDRIGITTDSRGLIPVNEHFQTLIPHIYAAGDVIGFPALASTSMEQARIAMVHAFQLGYKTDIARILPYGIFTIPECSMAGETEESLRSKGIPYVVGRASYGQNARGQIIGDTEGLLKLLFSQDEMKLLGVHVIGEMATELVHTGLSVLLMGGGADIFIQTCYNYPSLSELYKYATYDALGRKAAKAQAATKED